MLKIKNYNLLLLGYFKKFKYRFLKNSNYSSPLILIQKLDKKKIGFFDLNITMNSTVTVMWLTAKLKLKINV